MPLYSYLATTATDPGTHPLVGWLAAAALAVVTGIGGWVTARAWKPGAREHAIIERLQDDLERMQTQIDALTARVAAAEGRANRLRVHALNLHVQLATAAPPGLEWPHDL